MGGCTPVVGCVWRSEGSLEGSVLPFHHVGFRYGTQVVRLGGKCLSLLTDPSHHAWFTLHFFFFFQTRTHVDQTALCLNLLSSWHCSNVLWKSHTRMIPFLLGEKPVSSCCQRTGFILTTFFTSRSLGFQPLSHHI